MAAKTLTVIGLCDSLRGDLLLLFIANQVIKRNFLYSEALKLLKDIHLGRSRIRPNPENSIVRSIDEV